MGLLERPAAIGLLWGLVTGHIELGLGIGLFYELLWLDLFHAGTYIPPNSAASTLASLCLAEIWGLTTPPGMLLPLIAGLPLGLIGSKLEHFQRVWQNSAYNSLLQWARRSHQLEEPTDRHLQYVVIRSLLQNAILSFLFLASSLTIIWAALTPLRAPESFRMLDIEMGWAHIWFCALIGGVLALRVKRAYVTLVIGVITAAILGATLG